MEVKKYEKFSAEDLMEDEYFRRWVLNPDVDENTFWQQFIEAYPEKESTVLQAKEWLLALHDHFKQEVESIPKAKAVRSFQKISNKMTVANTAKTIRLRVLRWTAAASVLLVMGLAALYWLQQPSSSLISYTTGNGQRMQLFLPDSSQIQLNANSTVSYDPEEWEEKGIREVDLKGEAYFNVTKKEAGTKFIVHAGGVDVKVLGTAFNVRARTEDAEVVLAEGKIELNIEKQKILMKPGDYISYSKAKRKVKSKKVTPSDYTSWKDGIVVFNKNLSEVAKELEILYGVKFNIEKEDLKDRMIQLSAPADSLEQVLEILEIMYSEEINIQLKKGQVRIY